jgi:hypothetical protein
MESKRKSIISKRTKQLALWTLAWTLSMALVSFGPKFLWDFNPSISSAAIGINLLIGIGMIIANKNHLLSLDELEQKIHLQAMAITLGVAVVAGLAYSNLDISNVISGDAEISHLVILIGLTYISGVLIGKRRYQ